MSQSTDINAHKPEDAQKFERIERYETLAPGQFWRVIKMTPGVEASKRIDLGELLLVTSIGYADNEIHTIKVRYHPSKVDKFNTGTAFLVQDFLNAFEHVDKQEAERERQQEIQGQQKRITDLQQDLTRATTDVAYLDERVESDLPKEDTEDGGANLPVTFEALGSDVAGAIKTQKVAALMSPALTQNGITQIKSALNEHKEIAERRSKWLSNYTGTIGKEVERLTPYFEEVADVALAATKDIRDHIEEIMKGIDSLNLYVLKDVIIDTIQQGPSAPEDERLTVCQRVLFMDEEMAVFQDIDSDSFDFANQDQFFSALTSHPDLVKQIFPTERCIVGIATTREYKAYSERGMSDFEQADRYRRNNETYLLIRDGHNIHVVASPYQWHRHTKGLFPSYDDMDKPFTGIDGSNISYEDVRYTDSLGKFDAMALKYKQFLILLCGLDHKKQIFGPFYTGEPSLQFISLEFQKQRFNFIHDLGGDGLLKDDNRPLPFIEWLNDINSEIRPGSRILLNWRESFSPETISGAYEKETSYNNVHGNPRSLYFTPVNATEDLVEIIVRRRGSELVGSIDVSGYYEYSSEERSFTATFNVSALIESTGIGRPAPFICLDRAEPEEIHWYLHDRPSRTVNTRGIRLLKHALAFVTAEFSREKELRQQIADDIKSADLGIPESQLDSCINRSLAVWKCANPAKDPLDLLNDSKKYHKLCDQIARMNSEHNHLDDIIAAEEALDRKPLRVFIDAAGNYAVLSEPSESDKDDRLEPFYWVQKTRYHIRKKGISPATSTFVTLSRAQNDGHVLFESESIGEYRPPKHPKFATPAEKKRLLNIDPDIKSQINVLLEAEHDLEQFKMLVDKYTDIKNTMTDNRNNGYVHTCDHYIIPVGASVIDGRWYEPELITISWYYPQLLATLAGDSKERQQYVVEAMTSRYQDYHSHRKAIVEIIEKAQSRDKEVPILMAAGALMRKCDLQVPFENATPGIGAYYGESVPGENYRLFPTSKKYTEANEFFIAEPEVLEQLVGVQKPHDYSPVVVVIPSTNNDNDGSVQAQAFPLAGFDENELKQGDKGTGFSFKYFDTHREALHRMTQWEEISHHNSEKLTRRASSALSTGKSLSEQSQPVLAWDILTSTEQSDLF